MHRKDTAMPKDLPADPGPYRDFTLRNRGYIDPGGQEKIRATRVLVAGCGLGSTIAESLLRSGFVHLTLVDHDTVAAHNMNRQAYGRGDVGRRKVDALRDRLLAIFPEAEIAAVARRVSAENAATLVGNADLVMDTIDFLSLPDLIALHDAARKAQTPLLSCLSAGWGAVGFYFPPDGPCTARSLFGLPSTGSVDGASYTERFAGLMRALAGQLNPAIVGVMAEALRVMEDGTPCPASQVAAGGAAVAALAATLAVRVVSGRPVAAAPRLHLVDLDRLVETGTFTLGDATA
ncbi:MAG: ThiF family adenylyltransferase [Elusimicrobia bacterium]|jgi:molybdopterin/thiamine biosynthesis adenylyltransferase|nr:ThiF family adenylyltransferase [Elusimicrobiota bacterium]MBK7208045.1 ThiF family adenylyltransferase [Elusimicrobiota bacterium]MBK7544823.1 ThiF family adenylyltransferase [Elusimicrobiota bacterium]MBK7574335.1 ThiF family adenylyltransferase [Elusimicrobiota bacterium]MBK7688301.1 ThiF family adenylyltransferase [Elusimicrobiota bacterium]